MKIFDTHTHLNVEEFAGREEDELQLASEMGVSKINIVGFDRPTIERALELADSYDQLYATIGWHPTEAGTYDEPVEAYLLDKLDHRSPFAHPPRSPPRKSSRAERAYSALSRFRYPPCPLDSRFCSSLKFSF